MWVPHSLSAWPIQQDWPTDLVGEEESCVSHLDFIKGDISEVNIVDEEKNEFPLPCLQMHCKQWAVLPPLWLELVIAEDRV